MFQFLKWRLTLNFQIEFYIYLQENRLLPNSNTPDVDMAKQITTYGEVQEQLDLRCSDAQPLDESTNLKIIKENTHTVIIF